MGCLCRGRIFMFQFLFFVQLLLHIYLYFRLTLYSCPEAFELFHLFSMLGVFSSMELLLFLGFPQMKHFPFHYCHLSMTHQFPILHQVRSLKGSFLLVAMVLVVYHQDPSFLSSAIIPCFHGSILLLHQLAQFVLGK